MSSEPPIPTRKLVKDLTGQTFGSLRVVSRAPNRVTPTGRSVEACWNCECIHCGHSSVVPGYFLRTGKTKGDRCPGCKPDPSNEPLLPIDSAFVEKYKALIFASIGSVIRFGSPLFVNGKEDVFQEVLLQLSTIRGTVPEEAMSSLIWRIAHSRAINFLHKANRESSVSAAADAEEEGSYEYVLNSLTDGADDPEFSFKHCMMLEAFSELSDEDDQAFCRWYADTQGAKSGAEKQRMHKIRARLKARVKELQDSDSIERRSLAAA